MSGGFPPFPIRMWFVPVLGQDSRRETARDALAFTNWKDRGAQAKPEHWSQVRHGDHDDRFPACLWLQ
jgi:hypothetical protein